MDYPDSPDLFEGKFTDGDPVAGIPASVASADHMNAVYDELLNVITFAGITPSASTKNQLKTALEFYRNASNLNAGTVPAARLSGSYSITASNATNAAKLNNQDPSYYQNASNLNAGTLPVGRLPAINRVATDVTERLLVGGTTDNGVDKLQVDGSVRTVSTNGVAASKTFLGVVDGAQRSILTHFVTASRWVKLSIPMNNNQRVGALINFESIMAGWNGAGSVRTSGTIFTPASRKPQAEFASNGVGGFYYPTIPFKMYVNTTASNPNVVYIKCAHSQYQASLHKFDIQQADGFPVIVEAISEPDLTGFEEIANIAQNYTGMIVSFPTLSTPVGFLKLQDGELSRSSYASLFLFAISSGNMAASEAAKEPGQFGPGNGTTTFTLPNPQGLFVRVLDESEAVDAGRTIGSYQADDFKSHEHEQPYGGSAQAGNDNGGAPIGTATGYGTGRREPPVLATGGIETRPKNIAWPLYIKY